MCAMPGTGTLWTNSGPCLSDLSSDEMCAENWAFTFKSKDGGLAANVNRVWTTTWDKGRPPPGFVQGDTSGQKGDTFRVFIPDRRDIIRVADEKFATDFCKEHTNASATGRCGG